MHATKLNRKELDREAAIASGDGKMASIRKASRTARGGSLKGCRLRQKSLRRSTAGARTGPVWLDRPARDSIQVANPSCHAFAEYARNFPAIVCRDGDFAIQYFTRQLRLMHY
jgi:hypothetical protein